LPEDELSKGIDDLDESSDEDSGEAHRKEDEKSAELQRWQIKDEDLKIDYNRCLGKGSFGAVYLYVSFTIRHTSSGDFTRHILVHVSTKDLPLQNALVGPWGEIQSG
jgi:hypothetical protein